MQVIASLCILLSKIIGTYPLSTPGELGTLYESIGHAIAGALSSEDKANLWSGMVIILKTLSNHQPDYPDQFLPHLVKLLQAHLPSLPEIVS